MIEIVTTDPLLDFEGKPIPSYDIAVASDGRIVDVPIRDDDGNQALLTFRQAVFRALCRIDPATMDEEQKYLNGCLTAKVMTHDRVKLDTKELTAIRQASGAARPGGNPVLIHWALVQVLEGEVGQGDVPPALDSEA